MNAKQSIALGIALLLLSIPAHPNPIQAPFFNELMFTSNGWVLEINVVMTNLNGWYLRSNSGTAYFKDNIQLSGYTLVTQDSMLTPLGINHLGDSLTLHSPQGMVGRLMFGNSPSAEVAGPGEGQSICLKHLGGYYYLDNSPTLGLQNDDLNAMGTIQGFITDTLGTPVSGAAIWWYDLQGTYYSDAAGRFAFNEYARRIWLTVVHSSFEGEYFSVQIWPESTSTVNIVMHRLSAAPEDPGHPSTFGLGQNYPNPFNPATVIAFTIPRSSFVNLTVYDVYGRQVATLVSETRMAGSNEVQWNASGFASGVYYYRLNAGGFVQTRRMILIR